MFRIFPGKGVEISQRSSRGHIVSLYGLSISNHSGVRCVIYHTNVYSHVY